MKKLIKLAALALATNAAVANAEEVPVSFYMDLNSVLGTGYVDGVDAEYDDYVTDLFQFLVTESFNPVSVYTDTQGAVGIDSGDMVTDIAENIQIGQLNPISPDTNLIGGFGVDWGLSLDWSFSGVAVVEQDIAFGLPGVEQFNYLGQFDTGSITINITNGDGSAVLVDDAITAAFTGQDGLPLANRIATSFFGDVTSVAVSDTFFNGSNEDFVDVLSDGRQIPLSASGDILDLDSAPQLVDDANDPNDGKYVRTTTINSFDISVVPEPSTLAIMGLSLLGLGAMRRRKS